MFDNLIDAVKQQALEKVKSSVGLDSNTAEKAVDTSATTIFDSLKDQVLSGNGSSVTDLFKTNVKDMAQNALVKSITEKVVGGLVSKVGLSSDIAQKVSGVVMPIVVSVVNKKDQDSNDSFNISSMVGSFLGGGNKDDKKDDLLGGISKGLGGFFGK